MSYINENIDEFFQNAAEDYPLKTNVADWEAFSQQLPHIEDKRRNNIFLYRFMAAVIAGFLLLTPALRLNNSIEKNFVAKNDLTLNSTTAVIKGHHNENLVTDNKESNRQTGISFTTIEETAETISTESQFIPRLSIIDADAVKITDGNFVPNMIDESIDLKQPSNIIPADTYNEKNEATATTTPLQLKLQRPKRFYLGATLAPEISSVKHQSVTKPGFTGGFLAGYKVTDKLQVEIGMVLSHKYYYTKGKYAPPNTIRRGEQPVDNVNAFTSVTEIPLTVQYNFRNNGQSRTFVSAGTVSSLVHKDQYNFDYTKNGEERTGLRRYNKSSDNLFTNLQVSAGYETKLGNIGNIRIEPYYRLPLNGIGSANLPVTSAGINFGFTRFIK